METTNDLNMLYMQLYATQKAVNKMENGMYKNDLIAHIKRLKRKIRVMERKMIKENEKSNTL